MNSRDVANLIEATIGKRVEGQEWSPIVHIATFEGGKIWNKGGPWGVQITTETGKPGATFKKFNIIVEEVK